MKKILYQKITEEFYEDGFTIIRGLFSEKEVNFIKKSIDTFVSKESPKLKVRDINTINNKINSLHALKNSKELMSFANKKKIIKIGSYLLNEDCYVNAIELFAKPAKIGLKSPVHQDNAYWCLTKPKGLTMWIALTAANKKNGGIFYYVGTNNLNNLSHVPSHIKGSSQMIKPEIVKDLNKKKIKYFPSLEKGDACIHHAYICHGSGVNKSSRPRRGLTIQMFSKKAKKDILMQKKYEESLSWQISKRIN